MAVQKVGLMSWDLIRMGLWLPGNGVSRGRGYVLNSEFLPLNFPLLLSRSKQSIMHELKFLLYCQQTYRDLDADNRGKQSPHHERVKEHEPVAWDAESQTDGARCGGGAAGRDVGDGPLPLLFAHSCHPAKSQNSFC